MRALRGGKKIPLAEASPTLFPGAAEAEHFAQEGVGGLEVFVLGFDAFEEAFGVGAALAQCGHGAEGVFLAGGVTGAVGGDGGTGVGGGEFLDLAGELGDDQFGGAFADAVELNEGAGVLGFDGLGDLAHGGAEGAEGGLGADAFDGGEEVEEGLVFGAEEGDELGVEVAAAGGAFEVEDGVEGELFADLRGRDSTSAAGMRSSKTKGPERRWAVVSSTLASSPVRAEIMVGRF